MSFKDALEVVKQLKRLALALDESWVRAEVYRLTYNEAGTVEGEIQGWGRRSEGLAVGRRAVVFLIGGERNEVCVHDYTGQAHVLTPAQINKWLKGETFLPHALLILPGAEIRGSLVGNRRTAATTLRVRAAWRSATSAYIFEHVFEDDRGPWEIEPGQVAEHVEVHPWED